MKNLLWLKQCVHKHPRACRKSNLCTSVLLSLAVRSWWTSEFSGSSAGCDISSPSFLIIDKYLHRRNRISEYQQKCLLNKYLAPDGFWLSSQHECKKHSNMYELTYLPTLKFSIPRSSSQRKRNAYSETISGCRKRFAYHLGKKGNNLTGLLELTKKIWASAKLS